MISSHSHSQSSDASIIWHSRSACGAASAAESSESTTSRLITSSVSSLPPLDFTSATTLSKTRSSKHTTTSHVTGWSCHLCGAGLIFMFRSSMAFRPFFSYRAGSSAMSVS